MIREEKLQEHSLIVGEKLQQELARFADRHECVGDVRGAGLFIDFELVSDRTAKPLTTCWRWM